MARKCYTLAKRNEKIGKTVCKRARAKRKERKREREVKGNSLYVDNAGKRGIHKKDVGASTLNRKGPQ